MPPKKIKTKIQTNASGGGTLASKGKAEQDVEVEDEDEIDVELGRHGKHGSTSVPTDVYTTSENETPEQIIQARGYQLQEKLGAGAFATVFKAIKLTEQFVTACKVIEIKRKKKRRLNDLKHELYVLEKARHEHIIKLYEHFIIDEKVYIFMEFAAGGTLSEYVRKKGPLRESRAKRWFREIASAIQYMHSKGISHRDLKLGNILLNEHKQCKVTDFGLSRVSYKKDKGVLYCTSYCGTEPYMAPEILKKDEEGRRLYDPLIADIWALGVCLYAMINKAYPFNPEDKEIMITNQLQRKWKFVKKQRQKLSEEVKDLIRHLLEPEVKARITFHGIMAHPWLNTETNDEDKEDRLDEKKSEKKVDEKKTDAKKL
ncbi:protein kinase-like protein 1 [Dinothrombium tinctorium]|uniref:Protein kinase-like protein 1 n=1 Tax=Dinothrombium tinctorium TaxID=1965070 RepID=A0A3S3NT40_9ACAR|nr:protein kinase-like protein 1 [Dinothrombium tinctorium]RWS04194.1 protein kinase-like protein 1 [Dinothrombium tinctorium]